jgi:hypothetical protein
MWGNILASINACMLNQPTNQRTLSSWALFEKLLVAQLLENFAMFYGARRLITVFARALHWSLFWARSIQSIPFHHTSLTKIHIIHAYTQKIFFYRSSLFWKCLVLHVDNSAFELLIVCMNAIRSFRLFVGFDGLEDCCYLYQIRTL